jgi:hypothetical protein
MPLINLPAPAAKSPLQYAEARYVNALDSLRNLLCNLDGMDLASDDQLRRVEAYLAGNAGHVAASATALRVARADAHTHRVCVGFDAQDAHWHCHTHELYNVPW